MKVNSAKLIKTVYKIEDMPPEDKKEIAFAGRSNVGKSSLLNTLLGIKIAKVSSTPGKTRSINYYLVNDNYYFVDLPGYGFASVSKQEKEKWSYLLDDYFKNRKNLITVILLLDHRHVPQPLDYSMIEWLRELEIPFMFVLTKADKLKNFEKKKKFKEIQISLSNYGEYIYLPFSSKTKEGINLLLKTIGEILGD
ncbi:ribosome biogenesis GTP-binding protein YihA/YsxC [Petrotoga sp. 9PWA.NaAc.5.4]|uniref:ribosome biogenesis GTP-binding protein YihA/YsxC n=1 Tax=Petrotoga sp. 9PWA.NaAc.5.4 TaxID=1434328 RepID=UPI000CAC9470|nr:ribosome biogenesis GTP-binding protein YihA/YsxC [Petrotoga sp. 9PWA.NaAc.5.4]PNR94159.1 GTP-binding protein YsxC [Petrotoga sp. 9PWA.NaAc.5.4]